MLRIELYCRDEIEAGRLMKGSFNLLRESLLSGAFERGRAPEITGYADRHARKVLKDLLNKGLLVSDSPKGAVCPASITLSGRRQLGWPVFGRA